MRKHETVKNCFFLLFGADVDASTENSFTTTVHTHTLSQRRHNVF